MCFLILLCIIPSISQALEKRVDIHAEKHTHHISSLHDETTHTTKIIKEFNAPEGNSDLFSREIIGYELAQKSQLHVPRIEILPYHQTYRGKRECFYGISSSYIPNVEHAVELNIIRNAAQYVENLERHPELIDILAFDTVLGNIDRRKENLLKEKKSDGGVIWHCIDHEWILSPFQQPSIFVLNQYLINFLSQKGHEIPAFDALKKETICDDHLQFTRSHIFETNHGAAIQLAILLADPIKK